MRPLCAPRPAPIFGLPLLLALLLLSPALHAGLRWDPVPFTSSIVSPPLSALNSVYVLTEDGKVTVVDLGSGSIVSQFRLGTPSHVPPVRGASALVFATDDGFVQAVSAATGKMMWTYPPNLDASKRVPPAPGSANVSNLISLAAGGGMVYAVFDNLTLAFDEASGLVRWSRPLQQGGPSSADEEHLYVSDGPDLRPFLRATGSTPWVLGVGPLYRARPASDPARNRLYVASTSGSVSAIDLSTGNEVWSVPVNGWAMSTPLPVGDSVVFATNDRRLRAVSAVNGAQRWVSELPGPALGVPLLLERGGQSIVVVGTEAGLLAAYDALDGAPLWTYTARDWVESPIASPDGRTLLAAGRNGLLWAVWASPICSIDSPADEQAIGSEWEIRGRAWAWEGVRQVRMQVGVRELPALSLAGSGPFAYSIRLDPAQAGRLPIQCLAQDSGGLDELDAGSAKVEAIYAPQTQKNPLSLILPESAAPGSKVMVYVRNAQGFDMDGVSLRVGSDSYNITSPYELTAPRGDGSYEVEAERFGYEPATARLSVRTNQAPLLFLGAVLLVSAAFVGFLVWSSRKKPNAPTDYSKAENPKK